MNQDGIVDKISKLKIEKNAVILVHNYQRPEIYGVADFIGDSLELSRAAIGTKAGMIVFCGVDFMAESAKILNPGKKVLIPEIAAQCPMAKMVTPKQLLELKKMHPSAAVVSYVNTSAAVKAESDICCTSANAVEIVNSLPQDEIIFVPDEHLANYVQTKTRKKIIPWKGFCYVHSRITPDHVNELKKAHPAAMVLAHPECPLAVIAIADHVCSTAQMLKTARESPSQEFIVATERGMVERLRLEVPQKAFYSIDVTCIQQKKNSLVSVLLSLQDEIHEVELDPRTMARARQALDRMIALPKK